MNELENAIMLMTAKLSDLAARVEALEVKKSARFVPPTPVEVNEYSRSQKYSVDGQIFCDFYESKGWFIGKNKMKNWKMAVNTWQRSRAFDKPEQQTQSALCHKRLA